MYTVGEVAKMMQISKNTLRYYDEIDLLRPQMVKEENQYRYYSKEQLDQLALIMELKEFGFTLKEIKDFMKQENSVQKLKLKFQEKQFDIVHRIDNLKKINKLLQMRIENIDNGEVTIGKKSVMIVDDVEFIRNMQSKILNEYGFMVIAMAEDGEEAVGLYKKYKPDLVVMDIVMPKMDGIEALKEIRKVDENAKIIMCSGKNKISVINESFNNGALGFVPKPFNPQDLVQELKNAIKVENPLKRNIKIIEDIMAEIGNQEENRKISYNKIKEIEKYFDLKNVTVKDIEKICEEIIGQDDNENSHKIFKEIEAEARLLVKN